VTRLAKEIQRFKQHISTANPTTPYDIPFGKQYQKLLAECPGQNLLSLVIHLDGVGLVKSTNLKLWLCSVSLIELPPHIRTRRHNMPLLSMYIGHTEPNVKIWLKWSLNMVNQLKREVVPAYIQSLHYTEDPVKF
ncbi:unnamed protein product, partial [Didymodactylos carnosus]